MYGTLFSGIIIPVMELSQGTRIQKYLKWLNKTQWWKPEQLEELQNKKLRALIKHAYEKVPYYHRIFKERGLTSNDIKTVEDLQKLPILTKDEIRKNFAELMAKDFENWKPIQNATSGSTGEPLRYYITKNNLSIGWASGFRAWSWAGYKLGDKRVTLAGSSLLPSHMSFKKRFRYLLERNLPLSSLNMTEDVMEEYAQKIIKFKPKYIRGYPSALSILAKFLTENGIHDIQPVAVFTTAETLLPYQRKIIEDVFGCDVLDGYGCRDGGANAMECPEHSGCHIASEQVVMEFVKGGEKVSSGEMGEIIATDLHNYAMPFIRYAAGDVGIPTDEVCSCGRGLPLLKSIEGRVLDIISLENGTMLSGLPLTDEFEYIEKEKSGTFKQYQIVQESKNKLLIKIVKGDGYTQEDTRRILKGIKKHVGGSMDIKVEFVNNIPATKTGKRLFVVSKISKHRF